MAHELYEQTNKNKIRMGKHCRERWNNHLNPNLNKYFLFFNYSNFRLEKNFNSSFLLQKTYFISNKLIQL